MKLKTISAILLMFALLTGFNSVRADSDFEKAILKGKKPLKKEWTKAMKRF
ncbi:MAG: hypothetical protein IPM38_11775 [Ignavibacteria bacterium]|nr:hypothetical protein [Ignavibacteria bacterium]